MVIGWAGAQVGTQLTASLAEVGTLLLEFTALSRITNNPVRHPSSIILHTCPPSL